MEKGGENAREMKPQKLISSLNHRFSRACVSILMFRLERTAVCVCVLPVVSEDTESF